MSEIGKVAPSPIVITRLPRETPEHGHGGSGKGEEEHGRDEGHDEKNKRDEGEGGIDIYV